MCDGEYYIGIDIGGTSAKIGLVSGDGMVLRKTRIATNIFKNSADFLQHLTAAIKGLVGRSIDFSEIKGIGIGAPTANYHTGRIEGSVNLNWEEAIDIRSYLELIFGINVSVTNDANLAALGELNFGVGKDYSDFISVTVGTGVGSGIICNGELIHGLNDLGGEIGHATLIPYGRSCNCGKQGCLEAYVSIRGLLQTYHELTDNLSEITPLQIFQKAKDGEEKALKSISMTADYLGMGLANVASTVAPQCIVLSGGLANMGDIFLRPVKESFERNVLPNLQGKITLKISKFGDNEVSLLGATVLAKNKFRNRELNATNK